MLRISRLTQLSLLLLLSWTLEVQAAENPATADPYADPKNDPANPLKYIANNTLTAIGYAVFAASALSQTFCCWKWGARWMTALIIGGYAMAAGFGIRFGLHAHPESLGFYIGQYMFIVLSPCLFIAADYVLLGRLAKYTGSTDFLLVPAQRLTKVFVISDVITFLIQASGGGISASGNASSVNLGSKIFLTGLCIQLVSFVLFNVVFLVFIFRVKNKRPDIWSMDREKGWFHDWRSLAGVLGISCVGIIIRSLFRVVEASEGYGGHLSTTESYFYLLDTLPLFCAVAIYTPFWPGRFIRDDQPAQKAVEYLELRAQGNRELLSR